jgi:hypothetical protein
MQRGREGGREGAHFASFSLMEWFYEGHTSSAHRNNLDFIEHRHPTLKVQFATYNYHTMSQPRVTRPRAQQQQQQQQQQQLFGAQLAKAAPKRQLSNKPPPPQRLERSMLQRWHTRWRLGLQHYGRFLQKLQSLAKSDSSPVALKILSTDHISHFWR